MSAIFRAFRAFRVNQFKRPLAALASAGRAMADFAVPRVCLLCEHLMGEQTGLVCRACWARVPNLPRPWCARCGHPTSGARCRWCVLLPSRVVAARSVCWVPDGVGGELVHKLKYGGWTHLAESMAAEIARLRPWWTGESPVLVPVPLGVGRHRERGFNQSLVLATALAEQWQIPVCGAAIARVRETESQVRLTPAQRSANVHHAFAAGVAADAVRGKHVLLVDDVVTTAATLNACAVAAVAAGASTISYVTFGRARAAFDRSPTSRSD